MIRIFADSTNDLGNELIEKCNVKIIPLYITLGDKTAKDGVDVFPDDIYAWADANKNTPKTAAFSPDDLVGPFEEAKAAGDDVIFVGISEEMSGSCNIARLAAEVADYEDHVYVVDSRNLSTGIGLLILEICRMRDEGLSAPEIVEKVKEIIPRVRASFVLDQLVYLSRGGRCSTVTALLAGTLQLKPKIVVEDGKMHVDKKYRGKISAVIMKYAKDMEEALLNSETENIFITHSGFGQEILDDVKAYLESLHYFKNIYITRAGGVISSHCGPRTLGVLYIVKE